MSLKAMLGRKAYFLLPGRVTHTDFVLRLKNFFAICVKYLSDLINGYRTAYVYGPGIYTDSHLFGRKLTKRCESMYLSSNLSLSMEMYQDSHLLAKRCESLYIPDPYLMDQECTRIHTFSNKMPKTIKNEKV